MAHHYTAEELEHHLSYEIRMLNGAYELILKIGDLLSPGCATEEQKEIALNAMKEDFCLHGRLLLEFLTKDRINSARCFAQNYKASPPPNGIKKKLNNQIAHFMDSRTSDDPDKIGDLDRNDLFRWIESEFGKLIKKWNNDYLAVKLPSVDLSKIPSDSGLMFGPTGPTNPVTSISTGSASHIK